MTRESTNRTYLLRQYRDGSNLNARICLHERFSTNGSGFFRWYFDQSGIPDNASVLEVGCGTGQFWLENRDRIPPGWQVVLTDLSRGMVGEAEVALGPVSSNLEFRVADVQDLPFQSDSFDAVLANFMLYHVPDRQRAVAEVRRVLKPGGKFYAGRWAAGTCCNSKRNCGGSTPYWHIWRSQISVWNEGVTNSWSGSTAWKFCATTMRWRSPK